MVSTCYICRFLIQIRVLLQIDDDGMIKDIIRQTSGFMPRDIHTLVADASVNFLHKLSQSRITSVPEDVDKKSMKYPVVTPCFLKEELSNALDRSKKRVSTSLGTPRVRFNFASYNFKVYFYILSNYFLIFSMIILD